MLRQATQAGVVRGIHLTGGVPDLLPQGRRQQRDQRFLQGIALLPAGAIVQLAAADLFHQRAQDAAAGAVLGELAEGWPAFRQVAADFFAREVKGGVLDQAMGQDFAGTGRVHQGHLAREQFDALAVLAQLGAAAALDHEEAVAVVVVVDGGALAADRTGVGADLRHLQPREVLAGDLADEQAMAQRRARLEAAADALQGTEPGIEIVGADSWGNHRTPPERAEAGLCRYGEHN
ncbi:hypothetical protein D9M68_618760 [compost metagenome]